MEKLGLLTTYRSRAYRRLLEAVAAEAASNEGFLDNLKAAVRVPSSEWSLLMYFQLRTRLETTMLRFEQDPRKHDAINTANQLRSLIEAIGSMIKSDNWRVMDPMTKQQYFGLLLDLLRGVADRDRPRESQGSRSPYVAESRQDMDLYEQMQDTPGKRHGVAHGAGLLLFLFDQLGSNGLDARQKERITSLLRVIEQRFRLNSTARVSNSPDRTQVVVAHLRNIQTSKSDVDTAGS